MLKYVALTIGVYLHFTAVACDVCGGVSTSGMNGFTPTNDFHFIGFRSSYRRYFSHAESLLTGVATNSTEYFLQSDLMGKFQLSNRWQIIGTLPYSYATQIESGSKTYQSGIGDIGLQSFYTPVIQKDTNGIIQRQLNIGFGIKTPTGKYAESAHTMSNMFPGTGAFNFTLSANFIFQSGKNGGQIEASNSYSLQNKFGYQYGNSSSIGGTIFRMFKFSKTTFRPFVGFQASLILKDRIHGYTTSESMNNGEIISGKIGLNIIRANWFLSLYGQLPIYQNLGNGTVQQKELVSISLNYLISKKLKK